MTTRLPVESAPGPLEAFAQHFDPLFSQRSQRQAFRDYLAGLLLPAERNKTLTAIANTEPIIGAQAAPAQRLQWFLSESTWDAEAVNRCRLATLRTRPTIAPDANGALVIDETGDRKDGAKTAHVGRQYLGSVGKIDNGVVSVGALWADERLYYPLGVEPYSPAHWFAGGKNDPAFRTKPQIALDLVLAGRRRGYPSGRWWRTVSMGNTTPSGKDYTNAGSAMFLPCNPRMRGGIRWTRLVRWRRWRRRRGGTMPTNRATGERWRAPFGTDTRLDAGGREEEHISQKIPRPSRESMHTDAPGAPSPDVPRAIDHGHESRSANIPAIVDEDHRSRHCRACLYVRPSSW